MPQIEIDCLLRHCTDQDIKRAQAEWQAYHAVRALKGEVLRGSFSFQITGRGGLMISAGNVNVFIEDACFRAAGRLREKYGKDICIVPIPNSNAVFGERASFRTFDLAKRVAQLVGAPASSKDLIRWIRRVGRTHLNERARSVTAHKALMKLNGNVQQNIILFDDVVTSGSQLAAAKAVLEASGMNVIGLCTFAEVVDKGQRSDAPGWRTAIRTPYDGHDMADFFGELG